MDLEMIDGLMYDDDYINIPDIDNNYINIQPYNIIIPTTYLFNRIRTFVNNNLYYDEDQLTNIQYYRILAFLNEFNF